MDLTDYDHFDYGGKAHTLTAPNCIGGVARLLGLDCAPPARARVLELGCGQGSNLIPLAWYWPQAHFVGVDLASTPIARGNARLAALGLRNIELLHADATTLDPARYGPFDYVIAHGFLSWVPAEVRLRMFDLIAKVMAPQGVAYVSYNALPGCRVRHLIRDLMRFHTPSRDNLQHLLDDSSRLLGSIGQTDTGGTPPFFTMLAAEALEASKAGAAALLHDDLSADNQAFHLIEFCRLAADAGLAYLGDADLSSMFEPDDAPGLTVWLDERSAGDWARRQQYLDFAMGTRFRRSLLVHADAAPVPGLKADRLDAVHFFPRYRPVGRMHPHDASVALFQDREGRELTLDDPALKATMALFEASPAPTLTLADLAARFTGATPQQARQAAAGLLQPLITRGMLAPLAAGAPGVVDPSNHRHAGFAMSTLTRESIDADQSAVDNLHQGLVLDDPRLLAQLRQIDAGLASGLPGEQPVLRMIGRLGLLARPDDPAPGLREPPAPTPVAG